MRTKLTDALGIKYPIIQAPMTYIVTNQMTAAVSNAGGLGMMTTADKGPDDFPVEVKKVRELTDKPFGVSITAFTPKYKDYIEVIAAQKLPLVITALGTTKEVIAYLKQHGGLVMPIVGSLRQALRVEQDGSDMVIAEGYEGAGHIGSTGNMVIIAKAVDALKIPVVAGGGFANGRQLAAALALGAEGVYMGTRFLLTQESAAPVNIQQRYIRGGEQGTIVSDKFTGLRARMVRNRASEAAVKRRIRLPWQALPMLTVMKRTFNASWLELIQAGLGLRRTFKVSGAGYLTAVQGFRNAILSGEEEKYLLPGGQGAQLINDIPSCQELIERIVVEAEEALESLKTKIEPR